MAPNSSMAAAPVTSAGERARIRAQQRQVYITQVVFEGLNFTFATRGRELTAEERTQIPPAWREAHREFAQPGEALFVTLGDNFDRKWPDDGAPPFSIPIF